MKYEFSIPMPESTDKIDTASLINKEIEKSEIKNLYYALPATCPDNTGFEQLRTRSRNVERLNQCIELIKYALDNGFDFIYLLNSPKPFLYESRFLEQQFEKLDILINKLKEIGCKKYRVCNTQLISYLEKNYPDLELYASTSLEYQNIKQYINFLTLFKNVKEIVPAVDLNKNFKLLSNLRSKFPNTTIELMVNEGCMISCPLRTGHNLSIPYKLTNISNQKDNYTSSFFVNTCNDFVLKNVHIHLCNKNIIYPWEIEEYGKIGIKNFKLVGRNAEPAIVDKYLEYYKLYLKGIDDIRNIEDVPVKIFNHYLKEQDLPYTVKEIKQYLPSIEYFKQHGHLCSSVCDAECNYCEKCAEKIMNL